MLLWAQKFGGIGQDQGGKVAVDLQGNIYSTGYFSSSTITFGSYTLTNAGGMDIFTAKLDNDGNPIYAEKNGGILDDNAYDIAVDMNGRIAITGMFISPTIQFGNFTFTNADTINQTSDVFVALHEPIVGVTEKNYFSSKFSLQQNYPNPFNPQTAIGFSLLAVGNVTLKVYDVLGREVATLVNNETIQSGRHEIQFDGSALTSGVYFYRLNVDGKFSETKKFVLMK